MKIFRIIFYLLLLVLVILAITFAALNANPINLNYYIGTTHISLSLLLTYVLGIGILLGFSATFIPFLKLKREVRVLKRQLNKRPEPLPPSK
jgi:lipopolysaccharide assembly protein A